MDLRSHVDVVSSALGSNSSGFAVFHGQGPSDPLAQVPYWVVYSGIVTAEGTSAAPWADVSPEVQVTSVGAQADQAEYLADAAYTALIGTAHAPPAGRSWLRGGTACIGHVLTRPVERDDDYGAGSSLYYIVSIFSTPSTPS